MLRCQQKFCKNCSKPYFDLSGNFVFGACKITKHLILMSDKEETQNLDVQPLYCNEYVPRVRKLKY